MLLRVVPLGSGSAGNATLVEVAGMRLLVDAGLSARTLARRLSRVGVAPRQVDVVLLTHEHQDHARGAERFSTLYEVPLACSRATLAALDCSHTHFAGWQALEVGQPLELGAARVDAFPVPHDAVRPVGFVVEGGGVRCGIVTDIGHPTTLVARRLSGCDVLMVEANHDDRMLREGPYPWQLKQRVGGRYGHLSNAEAATLLGRAVAPRCREVVLAHLSEKNNTPALALGAVERELARAGRRDVRVHVARPDRPSDAVVVPAAAASLVHRQSRLF